MGIPYLFYWLIKMRKEDVVDYFKLRRLVEEPWKTVRFRRFKDSRKTLELRFIDGRRASLRGGYADYHMFHRIFLRDEYRVHHVGAKSWECVLDLGGNVGLFALFASSLAHRVLSFEPFQPNYQKLQLNITHCTDVVAFCKAVASQSGTLRLFHPSHARAKGEYHNVSPDDPRTRIQKFRLFLEEKGYEVEVIPHRRKENFGMFFASKPGLELNLNSIA